MGSNTSSTVNQTSQKVRDVLLYSPVNKKKNHVSSQNPQMSMSSPTLSLEGRVLKSCLKKTTNSPQNASLPTLTPSVTGNRKSLYKTAYSSTSTLSTEETAAPAVDIECESSCSTSSSSSSEEQAAAALKQAANTTATNQAIEGITKSGSNDSPQHGNNITRKNIQLAPIILSPTNSSNSSSPSSTGSRVQFADMRRSGSFSSMTYTNYINNHRVVDLSPKKASPSSSSSSSATCSSPRRFSSSSAPSNSPRIASVANGRMNLTISTSSSISSPTSTGSPTHHASNAKFQSPSSTGSSSSKTAPTRQLSLFEMYNNANTNSPKSPSKNDSFRTHKDFSMSKSDSKSMKNLYASRFGSIFNPSLNTTIQVPLLSVTQPDAPPSFVYYPKTSRSAQYLDVR